ncbi:non-ribosomal peptide synthetase [Burkholderia sp. ABCPW 111]|uniref:non-ribosomal peptide synthetase n=1 Tax=Burkholderia sp. ABCPW 111 TaxID=1820025 RepID=UPI000531EACD|nr:non-ribosomal peptide synthetase [Burkholderia sp. ABCPW 111]KGR93054.1 amino acid adenylation domain protein [Burkholderia sp. ABCPW 111]
MSDLHTSLASDPAAEADRVALDGASLRAELAAELAADLSVEPERLDADANLLQLGLDSMRLMAWLNRLRSRGHTLTLRELYREPTLAGWLALMRRSPARAVERPAAPRSWPTMRDGEAFSLTPVQHAYLVGRSAQQPLGGVGCHLYQEFDGAGLTPDRLESAVRALIARHPMLSVAFRADGSQQWRARSSWPGVAVHDLRECGEAARDAALAALRERLGHRVLDVEHGETFDFQLSLLPGGRHRLHVDLDLLVLDAASFTLVFDELAALVGGRALPDVGGGYDFRGYVAQLAHDGAAARDAAQRYWRAKLPALPAAPRLPLAQEPERVAPVRFRRRRAELVDADWRAFKAHASASGVTPTMALATCFGAVLARWSGEPRLLLNLTLFDREPLDPAVERMIADFTNILLIDLAAEGEPFDALARENQATFADAYEHRRWSGVELLRELRKAQRHPYGAPVVFTSNLGRPLYGRDTAAALGEPAWGISQTPQVWIDHLAFEHGASAWLQWDSIDALFPPGLVDALFDAYVALVRRLVREPDAWRKPLPDPMPDAQRAARARANDTARPVPEGRLHDGFFDAAARTPDAVALIHRDARLSFATLAEQARRCAGALAARGVRAGDTVAVSMSKGVGQIVAVLGALHAGAVYVPVPLDQPDERRRKIYDDARVKLVLACRDDPSAVAAADDPARYLAWQDAIAADALRDPVAVDPRTPAYVIYTSGSTGTPKGVVIPHRGALNTCAELTRRYRVGAGDRVLALSALHFDLSVYDIFGVLAAGGALVLVDEAQRRDPAAWCELIDRHRVTVWNSVPALFDMLLTYADGFALGAPSALRIAMLSGDWIGLDLPARYRAFRADGELVAMGGATEASIWSNAYDVGDVPPQWRSIPYGFPLANQRYRVVDEQRRDCPDWVPGELWIGGEGVALGYFNDAERTARQFVDDANGRWYRTGDLGCYWPDGTLEFLGRRDKQVKIGGYRIELGEIDAALNRIDGVKTGIALALGERDKSLAAFVVPSGDALFDERRADPAWPSDFRAWFAPPDASGIARSADADADANGDDARSADVDVDADADTGGDPRANAAACDAPAAIAKSDVDVERLVADFLHDHLQREGVIFDTPLDVDAALARYGAQPAWRALFARWLALLAAHGRVAEERGAYRRGPRHDGARRRPRADDPLFTTADALLAHHDALAAILRGQRPAHTLLDHPFWSPESLLLRSDGAGQTIDALAAALAALSRTLARPVRLVETGARSGMFGEALLRRLDARQLTYTAIDASQDMVLRAQARLAEFPHAQARRADPAALKDLAHAADAIWANNALHRLGEPALGELAALAAPSALVYVTELRRASALALVSADLLAHGAAAQHGLRGAQDWRRAFDARGLACEQADDVGAHQRFVLRAPAVVRTPDPRKLSEALAAQLPSYMLPQRLHFIDALPLTANGKIDHKALLSHCSPAAAAAADAARQAPQGEIETAVADVWRRLLQIDAVHRHSHFLQLGGDSLLATRVIGELDRAGYAARLGDLFDYPTLAAFAATLRPRAEPAAAALRRDAASRFAPFPLTNVQQAYLVGRQAGFALGGVGSHFFVEFEVERLDVARFEAAWNRLIARHDMLRAVVRDGRQQVLADAPPFVLARHRVASLDGPDAIALRERLAHQVLDPARWPVFDVQAAEDGGARSRLYVCLDNLLLDGLSMQILLAELEQLYVAPDRALPPLEIGFRDYVTHAAGRRASEASLAYWRRRLDDLPCAPQLPLRRAPGEIGTPRFARLSARLTRAQWDALKARAGAASLTPSALLLAAYSAVLSAWSAQRELCVNLTLFDRQPVHPQIEQVLGDFTSLLLLAWQPANNWLASAQRLQQRLWQDLAHRDVSALWVMRQLAQRHGRAAAEMSVVFTSALGFEHDRFLAHASWLEPRWGISQTPQVWLDHQVYESEGELRFNWDAVEALFEPDRLRAMFDQYVALLQRLASDASAWRLPLDVLVPRVGQAGARTPRGDAPAAANIATATHAARSTHAAAAPIDAARGDTPVDAALVGRLRQHFEQTLGLPIAARQSFFEAGATSLELVQWHVRLRHAGYASLAVTDLFTHASPHALAAHLGGASAPAAADDANRRARLDQRKANLQRRRGAAA